mmetsp:Transcript_7075/g.16519  ORF Transcript_7075/g.16519 Transcript_7075/m.16519 type:complete len:206 (-) Transcript_7075:2142-2759(-)
MDSILVLSWRCRGANAFKDIVQTRLVKSLGFLPKGRMRSIKRQGIQDHQFKHFPDPGIIFVILFSGLNQHGLQIHWTLDHIQIIRGHLFGHWFCKEQHVIFVLHALNQFQTPLFATHFAQEFRTINRMFSITRLFVFFLIQFRTARVNPKFAGIARQHVDFRVPPLSRFGMIPMRIHFGTWWQGIFILDHCRCRVILPIQATGIR